MKQTSRRVIAVIVGAVSITISILIVSRGSLTNGVMAANGPVTPAQRMDVPLAASEEWLSIKLETTQKPTSTRAESATINHTSSITPILQMLIPLYIYPDTASSNSRWDQVAAATCHIRVTAIINPDSGPGGECYEAYHKGIIRLDSANVTAIGYVDTNYSESDINDVKAEIDQYHDCYATDGLAGIFLDRVASGPEKIPYYKELCAYVKSKPNFDRAILNPCCRA